MWTIYLGILVICEFKISDLHTNILIPYLIFIFKTENNSVAYKLYTNV